MSTIQFNNEGDDTLSIASIRKRTQPHTPGLIGLVQKCSFGTISTDRSASIVLIVIVVLAISVGLFFITSTSKQLPDKDVHSIPGSDKPYYRVLNKNK